MSRVSHLFELLLQLLGDCVRLFPLHSRVAGLPLDVAQLPLEFGVCSANLTQRRLQLLRFIPAKTTDAVTSEARDDVS